MKKIIMVLLFLVLTLPAHAADLIVTFKNDTCQASIDGVQYRCNVGKNGITKDKREGDSKTPIGNFPLRSVMYRADKIPQSDLKNVTLPIKMIKPTDGWCDDPKNPDYNKMVDLRHFDLNVSHEKLYRDDDLYDLIVIVGYNDAPAIPYKGSAIFVHIARPGYAPGAGCVALSRQDLLQILSKLDNKSNLVVQG